MTLTPPPSVTSDTRTHGDGDATVRSVLCSMPRTPGARMIEAVAPLPTTFRLVPRPYQYEAVAALLAAAARGVRRPLLVLPTGTGKTIVFALLVQRRPGRSLILAHRDKLIQQAVAKLHLVDPTLELGVVQATRDEHTAPTVVASVQTLSRRSRLARLVPDFPHSTQFRGKRYPCSSKAARG